MSTAKRDNTAALDQSMPEITADSVRIFVRDVSAGTMREIGTLITDLETLRDRLRADSSRFERGILEHATLGQSVIKLANIASQSMVDLKDLSPIPGDTPPSTTHRTT